MKVAEAIAYCVLTVLCTMGLVAIGFHGPDVVKWATKTPPVVRGCKCCHGCKCTTCSCTPDYKCAVDCKCDYEKKRDEGDYEPMTASLHVQNGKKCIVRIEHEGLGYRAFTFWTFDDHGLPNYVRTTEKGEAITTHEAGPGPFKLGTSPVTIPLHPVSGDRP